jgi:hypothetical protein
MIFVGMSNGAYPPGTGWVSREGHAARAAVIRRLVETATIGVEQP